MKGVLPTNDYTARILSELKVRNGHESEFLQAATEILESLDPVFDKHPEFQQASGIE